MEKDDPVAAGATDGTRKITDDGGQDEDAEHDEADAANAGDAEVSTPYDS